MVHVGSLSVHTPAKGATMSYAFFFLGLFITIKALCYIKRESE